MTQEIRIPYFEVQDNANALAAEAIARRDEEAFNHIRNIKVRAVEKLGGTVADGEEPVDAWGRYIHEINGLEFSKPYHPAIVNAIRSNAEAYRFFFFLA